MREDLWHRKQACASFESINLPSHSEVPCDAFDDEHMQKDLEEFEKFRSHLEEEVTVINHQLKHNKDLDQIKKLTKIAMIAEEEDEDDDDEEHKSSPSRKNSQKDADRANNSSDEEKATKNLASLFLTAHKTEDDCNIGTQQKAEQEQRQRRCSSKSRLASFDD